MDHIGLDHEIDVDEIGGMGIVGLDAADPGRGHDHVIGSLNARRRQIPMADPPACVAQRLQTRPQFRFFTPQQQTSDRIASVSAGLRPEPVVGLGQKTPATHMPLLRRRDEHRANANTACFPGSGEMKRLVY